MSLNRGVYDTDSSTTHLLSAQFSMASTTRGSRNSSYATSITSVISGTSSITLNPLNHHQRGFRSREDYLAALREFEESKSYMDTGEFKVSGIYGKETMEEARDRLGPSLREERRIRKKAEALERERINRRQTLSSVPEAGARGQESIEPQTSRPCEAQTSSLNNDTPDPCGTREEPPKVGRMRRISRVFSAGRRASG